MAALTSIKNPPRLTNSTEDKTPVEVAIQLSLSEKEVTKYYTEYWRLKGLYRLYNI